VFVAVVGDPAGQLRQLTAGGGAFDAGPVSHVVLAQPGIGGPVRAGGPQQVIAFVQDELAAGLAGGAPRLQRAVPAGDAGLQALTAAQQELMARYDSAGSIPFIDIGNAYVQLSSLAPYGPQDLQHLTWSQIAAALHDPSSALAKSIDGSANYLTAAICKLTGNQPASACTPAVRTLESRLG